MNQFAAYLDSALVAKGWQRDELYAAILSCELLDDSEFTNYFPQYANGDSRVESIQLLLRDLSRQECLNIVSTFAVVTEQSFVKFREILILLVREQYREFLSAWSRLYDEECEFVMNYGPAWDIDQLIITRHFSENPFGNDEDLCRLLFLEGVVIDRDEFLTRNVLKKISRI